MARPIEVERVACQGVRNRSTIRVSCDNLASPTCGVSAISHNARKIELQAHAPYHMSRSLETGTTGRGGNKLTFSMAVP